MVLSDLTSAIVLTLVCKKGLILMDFLGDLDLLKRVCVPKRQTGEDGAPAEKGNLRMWRSVCWGGGCY